MAEEEMPAPSAGAWGSTLNPERPQRHEEVPSGKAAANALPEKLMLKDREGFSEKSEFKSRYAKKSRGL